MYALALSTTSLTCDFLSNPGYSQKDRMPSGESLQIINLEVAQRDEYILITLTLLKKFKGNVK